LLKDKMLNLVEEFPTRVLKNGSVFKSVVTGETINGRHPYERLQTFEPRCGHLIACNELPYNFDFSHGFVRRCVIVPFDHVFSSGMTKEQVVASMRPHYPGILRWAVEGAQRLLQNGAYTVPPSSSEAVDVWESDSNSIAQWYNLFCIGDESKYVPSTKEWVSSTKIYTVYVLWAKKHGLPTLSHTLFGRHLAKRGLAKKRNKSARLYGLTERLT
jgi:putative DNA primase/helicase